MINITIDKKDDVIEVEGHEPIKHVGSDAQMDAIALLIKRILDKAYYSGETICLEVRAKDGAFTEIERWH